MMASVNSPGPKSPKIVTTNVSFWNSDVIGREQQYHPFWVVRVAVTDLATVLTCGLFASAASSANAAHSLQERACD